MSLKSNFIYSSILTVSKYLFPLIVYPYVSRTLGLSSIGIVNFIDNIINYFVLVSMMGISTVGIREIAARKNNQDQLSKTFVSLLSITAITTLIVIIALWISMYTIPKLIPYQNLLYIGLIQLFFNFFLIEWFFTGMEKFKYITIRSILVKCAYVIAVFVFVRNASDYVTYYILSAAMVIANATINIIHSHKFVRYSFKSIDMKPFLKAFLIIGVYILLTNAYTYMNPVWLGFVTNTDEVGYFTTATKLHNLIMAVLFSFTNILFPRVSNLLAEGKKTEFWEKINTSFDAIFLFTFPTIIYILVAGPDLLHLIVGDGFEGAYLPLRIITPLVLIIGIEQILVIQILMATHEDNIVLRNAFWGAMVSIVLNILITSSMGAIGSAIVWIAAECAITLLSIHAIYKKMHFLMPFKRMAAYVVTYLPLFIISIIIYRCLDNRHVMLIILAFLIGGYTLLVESFILKNKVINIFLNRK